jgi:hypothetical protein
VTAGLGLAGALFLAGLVTTFVGPGLRGRIVGLSGMAIGALAMVVAAPPQPSWLVAATVAVTLAPLIAIAVLLRRRLAAQLGRAPSLDDDSW